MRGANGGRADVYDRDPALQLVVTMAVQQVRHADRQPRSAGFDGRKRRMVVHQIIRQQHLMVAPLTEVQRRKVIQRARRADARE